MKKYQVPGLFLTLFLWVISVAGVCQDVNPFQKKPQKSLLEGRLEIKYDKGISEGKQSYGGRCPAIQFSLGDPSGAPEALLLEGFRVYGSRYGGGFDPATTYVYVYIIDSNDQMLQKAAFPYSSFGFKPIWVDLVLKEPVPIKKGEKYLTVAVDPESHRTKGVYFHFSKNPQASHSMVASKGSGYKRLSDREWMIRAYFGKAGKILPAAQGIVPGGPPNIVSTTPAIGARDVDPSLQEIAVTFDRDMGGGMSWTGGGSQFPQIPEGKRGYWRDKRTCVLPVSLRPGHSYRVGINAPSFKNFKSTEGIPAKPTAITFTTGE